MKRIKNKFFICLFYQIYNFVPIKIIFFWIPAFAGMRH
ncbi:hypothetical protein Rsl_386 [Rickettsia slovaca 13-B]|uniref:Uncharacterized protein n=1 Tax=Rickettsia slovaca (strain 13-B) TaxID=941638 RepID=A0ABM5MR02_RICS1|nr:hypothetical protein Rsl_386 [Rickettsia slovaca 13-B]